MKTLHVLNSLGLGGAEVLVLNVARKRDRGRFEMAVASLGDDRYLAPAFEREGVRTFFLDRRPGIDARLPLRMRALVRSEGIDVIHTHNAGPWLYGAAAAVLAGRPLFHTEHSNVPDARRLLAAAERAMAFVTRSVIAVSEDVRRKLVQRQGLPAEKVLSVLNGVDTELYGRPFDRRARREALGLPPDAFVVGTVGRLAPVKDQVTLINAFALLAAAAPEARLVLVGDGPQRRALESRAMELGLTDRVLLLGRRDDVHDIVPAFDVFALSSISEGLPLAVLEAMAAGLGLVVTAVGGVGEAVERDVCGLHVSAREPEALGRALVRLHGDRALLERLGGAARARARARFDLSVMVRTYEDLYLRAGRTG
jgi:glycosyltransferase involved in cell wall biosynthesis